MRIFIFRLTLNDFVDLAARRYYPPDACLMDAH
jgi:hypothetical protein